MMSTKDLNLYRAADRVTITDDYKEYLDRPVIAGFKADITETHILVECEGITFVNCSMDLPIDLSTIEDKVSLVRKLARERGCKLVGINKALKAARDNYETYYGEIVKAMDTFRQLCAGWTGYVLHKGFDEDPYYNDYLQPLRFKLERMHWMNTLIMRYRKFSREIDEALQDLQATNRRPVSIPFSL